MVRLRAAKSSANMGLLGAPLPAGAKFFSAQRADFEMPFSRGVEGILVEVAGKCSGVAKLFCGGL